MYITKLIYIIKKIIAGIWISMYLYRGRSTPDRNSIYKTKFFFLFNILRFILPSVIFSWI